MISTAAAGQVWPDCSILLCDCNQSPSVSYIINFVFKYKMLKACINMLNFVCYHFLSPPCNAVMLSFFKSGGEREMDINVHRNGN